MVSGRFFTGYMLMTTPPWLDGTIYPDAGVPDELDSFGDQVDFIARLCSAWDFGLLPYAETLDEIRRPAWRPVVDACRLLTSPSYHLLRRWHVLPALPYMGRQLAYIKDDPYLSMV